MTRKDKVKDFFGKILFGVSVVLILGGIGLLIWLGVGQFRAQMNYDGQYIQWRMIQDISLWGFAGIPSLIIGVFLFPISMNLMA